MLKVLTLFAAVLVCIQCSPVQAEDQKDQKEQTVIIAEGDSLPMVKVGDLLRLSASGASGKTEISFAVQGPAKLVSTMKVRKFVNGRPLIGAMTKEFLVEAEKKGTATLTITTTDVVEKKSTKKDYKLEIE